MKKIKAAARKSITRDQFDLALMEEIKHAQGMNVTPNSLSGATAYCEQTANRAFGKRDWQKDASPEFKAAIDGVVQNALQERTEWTRKMAEQKQKVEEDARVKRLIIPPGLRN